MNDNIQFSLISLRNIRAEARKAGVVVPKNLTAFRSSVRPWFLVEGDGGFSKEVCADNAYEARERVIEALVDAKLNAK